MSDATIDALLDGLTADAGPGRTRRVRVGPDVLAEAAAWIVESHRGESQVVVCDANTADAAGRRVVAELRALGTATELWTLEPSPGDDHLVCDDGVVERVRARLADRGENPIAVGAGTISDIVKMAASQVDRDYQSVATAASMNGYTSAIAAVLSRGVKRTLPTRQAEAVFADLDVIAAAPAHLNRAGFGDMLSKPYSHADWLLSHLVRGVPYAEESARLLDDAYAALLDRAAAIGRADRDGLGTLTRAILVSGFSMALAGTSAPASGGEHLVSHYWDMEQHCRGLPLLGLHGTQVGVATRLSGVLFDRLLTLDAERIDPDACAARRPDDAWLDGLGAAHPRLTPAVVEEVRAQIRDKQRTGAALREELADVERRWPDIVDRLTRAVLPSASVTRALRAAGAADRPSAVGVGPDRAVHTLRVCRHIRSRYVALDLLDDLGLLHDWAADAVTAVET
jgi:glycerol-1-phosphate dehydrogenase [NAD(P)+]